MAKPERVAKKYNPDRIRSIIRDKRYNVCPSQMLPAMVASSKERVLGELRWGLVPPWADSLAAGNKMINARAETIAEKPSFQEAFRRKRCLIFVDGFYEWKRDVDSKRPFYFHSADDDVMAFAGIYETWTSSEGESTATCAIVTTEANELMKPIHHRMPVILSAEAGRTWLDPAGSDLRDLQQLLRPAETEVLRCYEVSPVVNSPMNDDPRCIEALETGS